MRTILFYIVLPVLLTACAFNAGAQSSTSKGTEFWTSYMIHINGVGTANPSKMGLYITSDVSTTGSVAFADGSTTINYAVAPNAVTFVQIPSSQFLGAGGQFLKGIHITSIKPVAVYAHIYGSSVSGATLLLPVNTLGKNYYSLNYTQISNNPSYSAFNVIATEDNTEVDITPTAALIAPVRPANQTFHISLKKGELYQGLSNTDLTGTKITSVSGVTATCKKIAVFSGSGKIGIGCSVATSLSSDNLFQQVYPTSAWGKNYVTVALKDRPYDIFRVVLSDLNTNVTINGAAVAANKFTGIYYEFNTSTTNSITNVITADKPIQVIQYTPTQNQTLAVPCKSTTGDIGDPEMIYLNPIEQGLNHVTLYSTGYYNILQSYINVVIPKEAVSSFTLDGVPYTAFLPVASDTRYSYAQIPVASGPKDPQVNAAYVPPTAGTHNIAASMPFNAIAYGFGATESYGYAAGTNLQDLNEYIVLQNTQTNLSTSAGCSGVAYTPQIRIPYQTTSIQWDLKDGNTQAAIKNPAYDHTETKGTQTLYVYNYPQTVTYTKSGDYTVVATVLNPTTDDCGSFQEITFDFNVADPPAPAFSKTGNTCLGSPNVFTDQSDLKGSVVKAWKWDFGDGQTAATASVTHTYNKAGDYNVTLTLTNENGCSATSAPQTVHIAELPKANFTFSTPACEAQDVTFTDGSTTAEGKITSWLWDFGDGTAPVTKTVGSPFAYKYAKAGTYQVSLKVTTLSGCISVAAIYPITISPTPVVDFDLPTVCLQNATAQFTDKTTITGTTGKPFKYQWDFGDANATPANPNTSVLANPTHQFTAAGVYHVLLTVTSNDVCIFSKQQDYTVSGIASFTAPARACPAEVITFTDKTETTPKAVTAWQWDFGDGDASTLQSPQHAYKKSGDYTVTLTVTGNNGCSTTSYSQPVHITALPQAGFKVLPPNCETMLITFNDVSSTAEGKIISWVWDFGDGTSPLVKTDNSPVTHRYTAAGSYTATLKVTGSTGCISDVFPQVVVVHPLPVVNFTLPDACVKDLSQFNSTTTIADHTESEFTYLWDFGDPAAAPANKTSTLAIGKHKYSSAGTYVVTLTITSKYGCRVIRQQNFTVNGDTPIADFRADDNNNTYCSSDVVKFIDDSSVGIGKITKIAMIYDLTGHPSDTTFYTKGELLQHQYPAINTPLATQKYKVEMIAYSGASCVSAPKFQDIEIKYTPVVAVAWPADPICQESGLVTIIPDTKGFTGTATFSGTGITTNGVFDPIKSGPGTFTINFTFKAENSCLYFDSHDITVNPTPSANAGGAITMLEGGTTTINATASSNVISYQWTLANGKKATGLSADNILRPVASPADDTEYMLTVTTANGCTKSSNVKITVLKAPLVPNTFTPNNDGINDTWQIKYLETYPNCTIDVYNRYGEKVYSSVGYAIPWNGIYKGTYLPVGTYYYIINPQNGRKVITGSITIIK